MGQQKRLRPKNLPDKLLAIRHKLGMSRSQLAKLIEFRKGAARISEYERGIRRPDLLVVLNYAKLAHISLDILTNDNLELIFPRTWTLPLHPQALLMQDRVLINDMPMEELRTLSLYSDHTIHEP